MLKVWTGSVWSWIKVRITGREIPDGVELASPSLIRRGNHWWLHTPIEKQFKNPGKIEKQITTNEQTKICSVDLMEETYAVLSAISRRYSSPQGRLPTRYSPVRHSLDCSNAFDLHVLGTPPAFILSQDQTRHFFNGSQSIFLNAKPLDMLGNVPLEFPTPRGVENSIRFSSFHRSVGGYCNKEGCPECSSDPNHYMAGFA